MFLLFATNNCFPTSDEKLLALFEFSRFFGTKGGGGATVACVLYASFFKIGGCLKLHHRLLQ
jgi:hypothetical protein